MRSLVILRGSPGSGKSTWVEKMNLNNYTLSADNIRMLVQSPELTENGYKISQLNDNYVWALLFELLEKRMSRGEFVIVDATHSRSSDFSRYNSLCEKYRYRRYYVDFSDVPIEECKRRNLQRPEYKQVPEKVIDKMYARLETQGKTSGWVQIDKDHFWEEIGVRIFDFNEYDNIHIFGDIHGCYTTLMEYINHNDSGNDMYIFCGDYLDRGIENLNTLEFLMHFPKDHNVLYLEGNHELWLKMYANGDEDSIRSRVFLNRTKFEISSIDKSDIRSFCRKIGQMAYFSYDGKKYLVTHGGLNVIPNELQLIATDQFIHGVGNYKIDIDEMYANNDNKDVIQVHGHRNVFELDDVQGKSYNLEGKIEFGGYLKVLRLTKGEQPTIVKIKNDVYNCNLNEHETPTIPDKWEADDYISALQNSRLVRETKVTDNVSSFNFTRDAFYNKKWDNITTKARGLFINLDKKKVVARGYDKFFNINERRETELPNLARRFKDKPIVAYKKYNGFLGIMSWVDDDFFIASKSTINSEYAGYFKEIFENSSIDKEKLKEYLSTNDVSLTFEVIDPINDPHIIKYDKPQIVLLDIIHNSFDFHREPYEKVVELSNMINCPCKEIYKEFTNFREFNEWYLKETDEDNMSQENLEGVVIEFENFMTKLKFPYYNFWKLMRGIKDSVSHGRNVKLSKLYNAEANYFYDYLKKQPKEALQRSIIDVREDYLNEK